MSALRELESLAKTKYRVAIVGIDVKMDSEKKESFGGEEEEVFWWSM